MKKIGLGLHYYVAGEQFWTIRLETAIDFILPVPAAINFEEKITSAILIHCQ